MGVGRPLAKWELKKNRLDPLTSGVFAKESVLGKYLQKVEIQKLISLKLCAPVYPLKRLCVLEARTPHSEGHGPEGECVSFSTWTVLSQPSFASRLLWDSPLSEHTHFLLHHQGFWGGEAGGERAANFSWQWDRGGAIEIKLHGYFDLFKTILPLFPKYTISCCSVPTPSLP